MCRCVSGESGQTYPGAARSAQQGQLSDLAGHSSCFGSHPAMRAALPPQVLQSVRVCVCGAGRGMEWMCSVGRTAGGQAPHLFVDFSAH